MHARKAHIIAGDVSSAPGPVPRSGLQVSPTADLACLTLLSMHAVLLTTWLAMTAPASCDPYHFALAWVEPIVPRCFNGDQAQFVAVIVTSHGGTLTDHGSWVLSLGMFSPSKNQPFRRWVDARFNVHLQHPEDWLIVKWALVRSARALHALWLSSVKPTALRVRVL